MTDEQLSALLRLKRYEQPPAGYFDQLLKDIHRKQRAELLHRPLWTIAWERAQTFFGEHSMGALSYGGAMAGILVFGVAIIGLMTPGDIQSNAGAVAKVAPQPTGNALSLQQSEPVASVFAQTQPLQTAPAAWERPVSAHPPRYVIDARPASYEPSFNF